ncbi:MAG: MiaB/RimO family radical SAM methylthiotransferase [Coriobacteriia bacterium]|nr:MiaB/RimO family radical SAM methylthiotransferase [Coriobacteriia bacterium]
MSDMNTELYNVAFDGAAVARPAFAIHYLGCKISQADSELIAAGLVSAGAIRTTPELADLIIITTCTVTAEAESKTRKAIRSMLALHSSKQVLASGCAIAIAAERFAAIDSRVSTAKEWPEALSRAIELLGLVGDGAGAWAGGAIAGGVTADDAWAGGATIPAAERTRYNLKIQDGCNGHCTFCIVAHARGPARSELESDIISRAQEAEARGTLEIVLTGVNLGSYRCQTGRTDDTQSDLTRLMQTLLEVTDKPRFRLSSLEPNDATDDLNALIASSKGRVCAHLHLPLQSGSDRILAAMGRPYDTAAYYERVAAARKQLPRLALSTDVIVGFPGESEADFQETLDFCREMAFMRIHVFRYSARTGTPAAELHDQIAPAIKRERSARLSQLADELAQADIVRRLGTTEQVLVEVPGRAHSESYHLVSLDSQIPPGTLLSVQFTGYQTKGKQIMFVTNAHHPSSQIS